MRKKAAGAGRVLEYKHNRTKMKYNRSKRDIIYIEMKASGLVDLVWIRCSERSVSRSVGTPRYPDEWNWIDSFLRKYRRKNEFRRMPLLCFALFTKVIDNGAGAYSRRYYSIVNPKNDFEMAMPWIVETTTE